LEKSVEAFITIQLKIVLYSPNKYTVTINNNVLDEVKKYCYDGNKKFRKLRPREVTLQPKKCTVFNPKKCFGSYHANIKSTLFNNLLQGA
jgi:hypothetical protein